MAKYRRPPTRAPGGWNSVHLTPRELDILRLLVAGAGTVVISESLSVTTNTARRHINNILAKLGVHSRVQAAARAIELHLV